MGEVFKGQYWELVEIGYAYINKASDKLLQHQSLRRDKELWLKEIQGLAVLAAYALAKNNKLQDAVMTLEQGLARLLLAKSKKHYTFKDIQNLAKEVPLVYIMMTELGGLALIVHNTTITPVWLDKLINITSMINYLDDYFKWQQELKEPSRSIQQNKFIKKLEETTSWLWQSIMKPLMTKIYPHTQIMLIAVGELSRLPFHAAWTEDKTAVTGKRYALDTLTIAYVPNARTLIEAKKIAKRVSSDSLLAVGAPETHIRNPLPNAKHEVETIASFFKKPQIITGKAATHDAVLNSLKNHDLLHFACHGSFEKGLVMANDKFISLENLSNLHFNARLVVLSSCETSITNMNLPDEAISLSNRFLQAGAAAVIASFWDVADDTKSMMIMIRFYDLWRKNGLKPVEALRQAQLWMRDSTNGEKLVYFKQCVDNATLKQIRNAIGFVKMENRDFAHSFHWASFNYVGV
jgi:CHAT domain-containing protein